MFSNVSPKWRTRLRVIVAAWALLLVAAAFLGSATTVREQVGAGEARQDMDAVLGEAAGYLSGGAHFLSAGPLVVDACSVTPLRPGAALERTLMVEGGREDTLEEIAERFDLTRNPDAERPTWFGTTGGYIELRLIEVELGLAELRARTGCRPEGAGVGVVSPAPPPGADDTWGFGALDCAGGGRLESWTTPSAEGPFEAEESTGGCA